MELNPVVYNDGYLPVEDHGLIGDLRTCALCGRDGRISWLCLPRFDSDPVICGILDREKGGFFTVAPERILGSRHYYLHDSGVLVTEMQGLTGMVRVTDALTLHAGTDLSEGVAVCRNELLRIAEVTEGSVRLRVDFSPRGGFTVSEQSGGFLLQTGRNPGLELHLSSSRPLKGPKGFVDLSAGERCWVRLTWGYHPHRYQPFDPEEILRNTNEAWHRWLEPFHYDGPRRELVRRSALTIKMLDYAESGAILAAPTSSLPERIGGERNWDYRYSWVRDAAFSVYALRRIGFSRESGAFLGWVLDSVERHGHPRILYTLDGESPPPEVLDPELEGYRRSPPVRWNNGASDQRQNDVYGEILDCAYQWIAGGGEIDAVLWETLSELVEAARREWRVPDHGIWEVRTPGRLFTYSVAMCQVALDRGARIARRVGLPGDADGWEAEAEAIREAILEQSWSERFGALTEHLGGEGGLDASLLCLPLRRVIPADHPKMTATAEAVVRRLGAGSGLVYRYLPEESPDGLEGEEGAFLLCSFWLVDHLTNNGRLEEALELYNSLCDRANHLGLLPEQIDADSGMFLGNFPQAFSHIGVVSSGFNLARKMNKNG
jgi:GH15 family glucan-1,4-alpha-glucosidase